MNIDLIENSLLAVSGGADSMYLLHQYRNVSGIRVAHVNYHIREDSNVDQKLVQDYCAKYGIPFHVMEVRPTKDTGIEEWARDVRYSFFKDLCDTFAINTIITAHNANDQAETVLMRLLRGTGFAGLAGVHKQMGKLVRPMLHLTKEFIYAECKRLDIPYHEDSTNVDTKYLRNWFRHEYVDESMVDPLCNIASMVQELLPKLIDLASYEYADTVIVDGNQIKIDKNLGQDDLLFLYLAHVMRKNCSLTEKLYNNIFSTDSSLNKFTTIDLVCDKRKKKWNIITFK